VNDRIDERKGDKGATTTTIVHIGTHKRTNTQQLACAYVGAKKWLENRKNSILSLKKYIQEDSFNESTK
jgi:hypothetical protein